MMELANTHPPINGPLAVIDGGLNFKADVQTLSTTHKPRLLEQVRQAIRTRHYSDRTEKAYIHWIKRYILFHDKRHPAEMAEPEIGRFLSSLATDRHVSASTQNQAFNALLFLYQEIAQTDRTHRRRGARQAAAAVAGRVDERRSEESD